MRQVLRASAKCGNQRGKAGRGVGVGEPAANEGSIVGAQEMLMGSRKGLDDKELGASLENTQIPVSKRR